MSGSKNDFISQRGYSVLEVSLSMAIVAMVAPFLYSQILSANTTVVDTVMAEKVMGLRNGVLNFVRMNQDAWPDVAQIRLSDEELDAISELPTAGFIDKYAVRGATVADIYLAFDLGYDALRTNKLARAIGADAAVVADDGIAYGASWAVAAPDFQPGNLIYRISRNTAGEDTSKYLHRAGEDGLNVMMRDMNMGKNNIYDIGTVIGKSISATNLSTTFLETELLSADNIYFSSGANLSADTAFVGDLRVTGDLSGFRNIYADVINGTGLGTVGNVVADRAAVTNSLTVGGNFNLRSESARTVSGFTALSAGSVATTFIGADEIVFLENFGLTISGELLRAGSAPLRIGNWYFPSGKAPRFDELKLGRAKIPAAPDKREFDIIMKSGWRDVPAVDSVMGAPVIK